MASKSCKTRSKKTVETTLGKAPTQNNVDYAHLQKPMCTSVFGLKQVVSLLETGTKEVQNYLTYECDVLYECKTCRTLFRSLANFILHKRNYCKAQYHPTNDLNDASEEVPDESTPNTPETKSDSSKKSLSPIIQKLLEKQQIIELGQLAVNENLSNDNNKIPCREENLSKQKILLEQIENNESAVFQTMLSNTVQGHIEKEFMKSEVMEIHGILDSDEVVLGPDGKICTFQTESLNRKKNIPKSNLVCPVCNNKFSTKKTLTYHIKYKHNQTRIVYICPDCKETFANAWSVYRHLLKVHRRTNSQVKRMRDQIHSSCVRKDEEPAKKIGKETNVDETIDEENQWMNNFEGDNDLQMCGGCGKRFERKAALHSHSQLCLKRINVCNTIKENNLRKKENDEKDQKLKKNEKNLNVDIARGSAKRKPYLLRTYKTFIQDESNVDSEKSIAENENLIDDLNRSDTTSECADLEEKKETNSKNNSNQHTTKVITEEQSEINSILIDDSDTDDSYINNISSDSNKIYVKPIETLIDNLNTSGRKLLTDTCISDSDTDRMSNNSSQNISCEKIEEIVTVLDSKIESNSDQDNGNTCFKKIKEENTAILDCKIQSNSDQGEKIEENTAVPDGNNCENIKEEMQSYSDKADIKEEDSLVIPAQISNDISEEEIKEEPDDVNMKKRTLENNMSDMNEDKKVYEEEESDLGFIKKALPFMNQEALHCISCRKTFASLSQLLWHMSAHFSWFRYQCCRCSFISFNKCYCIEHAHKKHGIHHSVMESVVLPIPNWKTVLMSHDFQPLEQDSDLGGKLTDEVIYVIPEEIINSNNEIACNGNQFGSNLFYECFTNNDTESCKNSLNVKKFENNEIIDIIDDGEDSFQIEQPQEIYIIDHSEILKHGLDMERINEAKNDVSIKLEALEEDVEENFLPMNVLNSKQHLKKTELQISSSEEVKPCVPMKQELNSPKACDIVVSSSMISQRPTRVRTKSVRFLQSDFLYDLTKVIKLNDAGRVTTSRSKRPAIVHKNNTLIAASKRRKMDSKRT